MSTRTAPPALADDLVGRIVGGAEPRPHDWLGRHPLATGPDGVERWVLRVVRPLADRVTAVFTDGSRADYDHTQDGLWQLVTTVDGDYRVDAAYGDAPVWQAEDPYRFAPTVGELDLHLWGEGRHEEIWKVFGAQQREHEGVTGTGFSVWAPHAQAVRVVGAFNEWNGALHPMRRLDGVGVWELFIPGVGAGTTYKWEILTQDGRWVTRADPLARYTETPPHTASVVGTSSYDWQDGDWLRERAERDPHTGPASIYEVHLGSWRPGLSYREMADHLIEYVSELGFTHVELMPVAEHPYAPSWGYQVTGYYAPTSRFGHPDDFRYLVDRLHQAGIGVIMDWVPGHFPKDEWALADFDGQALYEHSDPRRGEQLDWGTKIFNFGDSQVRNFLVANALYWLEEFHIDGLRVDAVASMLYLDYSREEWLPNQYGGRENLEAIALLQEVNATAYKRSPGIMMIAEESTSWPGVTKPTDQGGLGFGLKWNMGWMNDTLRYIEVDPMYRTHHRNDLTFGFVYAFSEQFMLPISHDEVVHGKGSLLSKMPGDQWQKLANVRAYLAFMWAHPGKKLLFMGQEFGQPSEWSEGRGLDWWILDQPVHRGLFDLVARLNALYREMPALWQLDHSSEGFEMLGGEGEVLAFIRRDSEGRPLVALFNFSGNPVHDFRVALPHAGAWREVLNTDAEAYGGSGVGNFGTVHATDEPHEGRPASAVLTLPPLGALWLTPGD